MLNNEFEKQVESAMLLIAQEQIPDTPHRFPPDFEARLIQQTADTGIEQTHMKTAQPIREHKSKSAGLVSRLLTWGSLAAGVMAAVTVGAVMLHEQRDEMQQLSSIPVETVENVSSDRDAAAIFTSTPPVESRQHETIAEQAISNILTTESAASPAKTSVTAIETRSLPETETTASQKADNPEFAFTAKSTKAILSSETSTTAAMTTVPENVASVKSDAETLFEKYLEYYSVEETPYDAPEDHVNPALLAKNKELQVSDTMYYRADGKQYTAYWEPAPDEHYARNPWCSYDDALNLVYHDCICADGIYYGLQDDNTYAVAGADYDYFIEKGMTVLNIPAELEGKPVTGIAKSAFSYAKYQWKDLCAIILPDSIQRICADAFNRVFADCAADCKINMPQNIRYLGNGAFYNAMQAFGDTLILPDSIEYVHWNALQDHDLERSAASEYVRLVVPEHIFLTTDGFLRTQDSVDESVVTGDQMLSIIDAIPYVIEKHPENIKTIPLC